MTAAKGADSIVENALTVVTSSMESELTEGNLDRMVNSFIVLSREIPDAGMRNFENEISPVPHEMMKAQSMFALYVLGKLTPKFDLWHKETQWEVNEPN